MFSCVQPILGTKFDRDFDMSVVQKDDGPFLRIAKKSLMGVVKWVSKMNELMTVVNVCMDQHPVPFHLDDFTRYMERFAGVKKMSTDSV